MALSSIQNISEMLDRSLPHDQNSQCLQGISGAFWDERSTGGMNRWRPPAITYLRRVCALRSFEPGTTRSQNNFRPSSTPQGSFWQFFREKLRTRTAMSIINCPIKPVYFQDLTEFSSLFCLDENRAPTSAPIESRRIESVV